jgi:hypothetical protein
LKIARTEDDPGVVNKAASGRVYPNRRVAKQHNAAPIHIKGRRLPKRDFELSASTPKDTLSGLKKRSAREAHTYQGLDNEAREGPGEEDHCH